MLDVSLISYTHNITTCNLLSNVGMGQWGPNQILAQTQIRPPTLYFAAVLAVQYHGKVPAVSLKTSGTLTPARGTLGALQHHSIAGDLQVTTQQVKLCIALHRCARLVFGSVKISLSDRPQLVQAAGAFNLRFDRSLTLSAADWIPDTYATNKTTNVLP